MINEVCKGEMFRNAWKNYKIMKHLLEGLLNILILPYWMRKKMRDFCNNLLNKR
jgi:hypothetical protein